MSFESEISRRRTFAIISHPDAGKTTLTEKLLLYGGALQAAGSVRAKKNQKNTTSDWMDLERERGISVSSTVLQFEYRGYCINLLDTPGHRDFSEDTYRVLTAVDSVIMVIDAGKGIEERTRKLFEICRLRGIPIFTFMNKMDRPARNPLELLDDIEKTLGLEVFPVTWPLGDGPDFKGVYDRLTHKLHLFTNQGHGAAKAAAQTTGPDDPQLAALLSPMMLKEWQDQIELLSMAGEEFDDKLVRSGQMTPIFFGSGINNFGVQLLLDYFVDHGMPPLPRKSSLGEIAPTREEFSGFIFKIQANMDPNHRDSMSLVRVGSGQFVKDMTVPNPRGGRPLRLSYPQKLFGQGRDSIENAYPGDIIGLVSHGSFRIGDTLTTIPGLVYNEIPRFAPEVFCFLRNAAPSKYKQFTEGLEQLLNEGAIQVYHLHSDVNRAPLLGAVGQLQFEVVKHRMETEYNAEVRLEDTPYTQIRWLANAADADKFKGAYLGSNVRLAVDHEEMPVLLFPDSWAVNYFVEKNHDIKLLTHSPMQGDTI